MTVLAAAGCDSRRHCRRAAIGAAVVAPAEPIHVVNAETRFGFAFALKLVVYKPLRDSRYGAACGPPRSVCQPFLHYGVRECVAALHSVSTPKYSRAYISLMFALSL